MADMKALLAVIFAGSVLLNLASAQSASAPAGPDFQLGHGVNLGNMLEAPKEGAWGVTVQEDYFPTIRSAGFTVIRVPIRWAAHVGTAPDYTIDPTFFNRVDWVVAQAEKNDLKAILDYHNDDALMKDPDANADRFVAIWKQIAEHCENAPPSILVVVGPGAWNGSGALPKLMLPESDPNLLVTVHFYDPFHFTHQGASWAEGSTAWLGTTWGTDADKKAVTDSFATAAKWGADHLRPMYLGEFGAYSTSPIEGRARWTAFVARTAEAHGMPWTYWEFCSGFGAYDPVARQWRQPLLDALLGR
jgi:endoglucanase